MAYVRRYVCSLHKRLPADVREAVERALSNPAPGLATLRDVYESFGLAGYGINFQALCRFSRRRQPGRRVTSSLEKLLTPEQREAISRALSRPGPRVGTVSEVHEAFGLARFGISLSALNRFDRRRRKKK